MKKFTLLSLFAVLFLATFAGAQCVAPCIFYSGDFDVNNPNTNGLSNENDAIIGGNPYGAATYENFKIGGTTANVTGLYTNNLSALNPASGYWEIRSGVSEGNGGTLIASGTGSGANFSQTPTGRSGFGFTEYTDLVSGLNIDLAVGTYWMAVVPQDPLNANRSFNSNTFGSKIGCGRWCCPASSVPLVARSRSYTTIKRAAFSTPPRRSGLMP